MTVRTPVTAPVVLASIALAASVHAQPATVSRATSFSAPALVEHVKVLASDAFEGRAPGSKGEDLTIAYLTEQFKALGLAPGNADGTYVQPVPIVGMTTDPATQLKFEKADATQTLAYRDDYVAWTRRVVDRIAIEKSELVFVGYGVMASEFNWDDYKGVDLAGKTLVVLIGDPPVPDPAKPDALDPKTFGGRAMTYYGRWTYKFEMGAEKKAAGVIIVHETGPAGYPFSVVQGMGGEKFDLRTPDRNMGRSAVEGWITLDRAKQLFAMAGHDFDAMKKRALSREFTPVPLGSRRRSRSRTRSGRWIHATSSRSSQAAIQHWPTSTSSTRRTGITSGSACPSTATGSTTAPSTTRPAPRA